MTYTFINIHPEGKPLIVAVFDDPAYDLLNAFLLTEVRSYAKSLLSFLKKGKPSSFSGNAFTLTCHDQYVTLIQRVSDGETLTMTRKELRTLIKDYIKELKKTVGA